MDFSEAHIFKDAQTWRYWLDQNHNKLNEAWLVIIKKASEQIGLRYEEALEEALCFGWIDGIMKSVDHDRFVLRFSPRKVKSIWSKKNKDKATQLITQGKMTAAGSEKIEEAKRYGSWDAAYTNKKRDEIPPDLKKALVKNPTAWAHFEGFANSYQNMYIGWVISAKTDKTRKKRIIDVVERSTLNIKPGI